MVASKTSIIFAAVALGAASTYAVPSFDRNLVRRAPHEESGIAGLAPRDVMAAAAAGTSDPTTGGASDIAVTAVSSTSDKAKPGPYKHKDEGYESGEEGHKGVEGHRHHHHHHHHKGHHRHHHHHDEELYDAAFEEGFGAGYAAGLIGDMGFQGDQHRHHGHHRHHHHHGYHPHHEESADASAKASVNETVTVQTQASLQPTHVKRSFNNIVKRGGDNGMYDGSTDPSVSSDASMMPPPGSRPGREQGGKRRGEQNPWKGKSHKRRRKPRCKFVGEQNCRPRREDNDRSRPHSDSGRRQRRPKQDADLNAADAGQAQDMTPPSDGSSDADAPPMKRSWKRDLAHGLGLEDEFFMKRAYEEDEFMY